MGLVADYGSSDESDYDSQSSQDKLSKNQSDQESNEPEVEEQVIPNQEKDNVDSLGEVFRSPYIQFSEDFGLDISADPLEIERLKVRALTQPEEMPEMLSMNENNSLDEPDARIEDKIAKLLELKRSGQASLNEKLAANIEYNRPGFVDGQLESLLGPILSDPGGFTKYSSELCDYTSLPEDGYIENLIEASKLNKNNRTKIEFVPKS